MIVDCKRQPRTEVAIDKRTALFERRGKAIELFIGKGLSIQEISQITGNCVTIVSTDISYYFKKPETDLILQSKV